jgi:alpha-amylase/alpha-mannosidase (GH57 family)
LKYLAFLFHLYQPPTQLGWVVDKIVEDCYLPLTDLLNSRLNPRFNININYSLTELLVSLGHEKVLRNLSSAASAGKVEFTESGAYHPIFPLIPEDEVVRQLELNHTKNKAVFGECYDPKGIFPPEMCYNSRAARITREMGYKWIITDDLPFSYYNKNVPSSHIIDVDGTGVFLRSNRWSNELSFNTWKGNDFISEIRSVLDGWFGDKDGYLVIAMDGETFGHHHHYYHEKFIHAMLSSLADDPRDIKLVTLSEIFEKFPKKPSFVPPSTWSASMEDLYSDDPYPLWRSKFNPIQHNQWQLTYHILRLVRTVEDAELRSLMDRALYSCQYWWASSWHFDPSQIYRGSFLLLDTLEKYSRLTGDKESLRLGRELYNNLTYTVLERILKQEGRLK